MIKRVFFAILYYGGLTRLAAWWNRHRVMILCYHCVTPRPDLISDDPWKMFLAADLFGRQLDFLRRKYNVVALEDYLAARREGRRLAPRSVVLTFDDGKRNFLTVIAPALAKLQMPATTFVVVGNTEKARFSGKFENPEEWRPEDDTNDLSWNDVARLLRGGRIEVGSHTLTHPRLTEIPAADVEYELESSYRKLAAQTARRPVALAYPHGSATEEVMKIAEQTGYSCGLTNNDGGNDATTGLFRLNRTIINADDELPVFAARVAGLTGKFCALKNRLRPLRFNSGRPTARLPKFGAAVTKNFFF